MKRTRCECSIDCWRCLTAPGEIPGEMGIGDNFGQKVRKMFDVHLSKQVTLFTKTYAVIQWAHPIG